MGRLKAFGASVLLLCALGLLYAPAASADSGDLIPTTDSNVDPIDKALDKANKTSDEATDKVDEGTDRVTDEVDETTGGNEGDRVDSVVTATTQTLDENVEYVTGPNGPVRETKNKVLGTVKEALGQTSGPAIARGGIDGFVNGARADGHEGAATTGSSGDTRSVDLDLSGAGDATNATSSPTSTPQPSLAEQFQRRIQELVQAMAFPLILALLIGAFLLIQNRIDSHDPKMLLSAIDPDQNYLTFR